MAFVINYEDKKKKSFDTEMDINWFIGAYNNESIKQQVREELYYKLCERHGMPMYWDDGTEMTGREWVMCVNAIYEELG